jgi:hypothetical protein
MNVETTTIATIMNATMINGIRSGDITQNQLQLIVPNSFRAMKRMVRSPENPMLLDVLLFIILFY